MVCGKHYRFTRMPGDILKICLCQHCVGYEDANREGEGDEQPRIDLSLQSYADDITQRCLQPLNKSEQVVRRSN